MGSSARVVGVMRTLEILFLEYARAKQSFMTRTQKSQETDCNFLSKSTGLR